MAFAQALLAIIVSLLIVVGLHEAGHAIAARLFGVRIKRIAIGFGKPLLKKKGKSGIEWVWGLWPLGGYVLLLNSRHQKIKPKEKPYCFDKKPIWQRIVILSAGALVNIAVAWVAFVVIYMAGYKSQLPVIAKVTPNSIAAQAGLKKHDEIVSISGTEVESWREIAMVIISNLGKKQVEITVSKPKGKYQERFINLSNWRYNREQNTLFAMIGIQPELDKSYRRKMGGLPFLKAAIKGVEKLFDLTFFYFSLLKLLLTGVLPLSVLLGPIGLFSEMIATFAKGSLIFLYFIGNLSLAVAVINLFPIPGLDGGSILYALLEKIRGKPLSVAMEILLHRLALIVMIVFLIQLLMNDLQRYVQG